MKFLLGKCAAVFMAFGLAACASGPQPLVQGVERIGVASVIGGELGMRRVSLGGLSKSKDRALIPDWGLDEYAEGEMTVLLQDRYQIMPLQVARHAKEAYRVAQADFTMRQTGPLDAYVIIVPAKRKPRMGKDMDFRYEGVGVHQKVTSRNLEVYVYAMADLVLLDGRTLEELRRVPLVDREKGADGTVVDGAYTDGDTRMVSNGPEWPERLAELSNGQSQAVADALAILLRRSLNHSLVEIGLTQ
ncbi:MAG: hypothetical protein ACPG1C_14455 [Alphaproteobacteria bacterium]